MKFKKKIYIYVLAAVAVIFLIRFVITSRNIHVVKGSTLMEKDSAWNYVVANYVNMKNINIVIDGSPYRVQPGQIYMDDKRNILISYEVLKKIFSCATNRYFNSMLVVEKGNNRLIFTAGSNVLSVNGVDEEMRTATAVVDGTIYVPLRSLCKNINYDYLWNYENNTISISNLKPDDKIFPYSYDYRNDGKVPRIKNQADLGTCWAFASLTALSTSLLPESKYDFSVDHLNFHNGYGLAPNEGGEYLMSMAYLAGWKGPVLEQDDPYGDGVSPDGLKPVVHVQEMQVIESKNYNDIKKSIFLYGGVQSSLYMSLNDASGYSSQYYNAATSSYCYIGTEKSNHDIVIIGWDDSYPAENFATAPEGNGAFICMNSWGENFGDNGYFYVSYYDSNIGIHNVVYSRVESADNYDNIYQSDELGWIGQLGYSKEDAFFSNIYISDKREKLKAVSFYATGDDTEYEIYCIPDFVDSNSFNSKSFVTKGTLNHAGYYTIDLENEFILEPGKKFAVVIYIKTPNAIHPVAIEYNSGQIPNVRVDDGEGYISSNGKIWDRVETSHNCNLCLKIFTDNIEENGVIIE